MATPKTLQEIAEDVQSAFPKCTGPGLSAYQLGAICGLTKEQVDDLRKRWLSTAEGKAYAAMRYSLAETGRTSSSSPNPSNWVRHPDGTVGPRKRQGE